MELLQLSSGIKTKLVCLVVVIAVYWPASSAFAAGQEVAQIPFVDAPPGTAGLGGGIRFGNVNYVTTVEHEPNRDLIPLYLYEGRWLFAHGTAGGIHFIKNDRFSISAVAQYRFQKLDPETDPFYMGLEERRQTLDAGLRAQLTGDWGRLSLQYVADSLDRHNGNEAQLSYRYAWQFGSWLLSPYVSWGLQSDNLANYYFGVSEAEARPDLPAYAPGESQFLTYGLNSSYKLTERLLVFGNIGFFGTDDSIKDSPLVEDGRGASGFLGATYMFGNVFKPTTDENRSTEWSWRVNYGYQADGNIISEIDQGDFSKSSVVDTNIAGFALSRILTDTKRVDFYGKFAIYRHLEEPHQENFNSYNAYIMAMAKGYSPWSGNELFRWGFGFGVSYADQVPMAEQLKQAEKGGTTSRFLNYLELQVDFPLRRISKAKWLQNCYAGMTVVHRSGIFGTVDMFSNVSGGADWITASLDCVRR